MRPLRSILAATDLSSGSDAIVRSAGLMAARTGAELHLLHSLELPLLRSEGVRPGSGFYGLLDSAEERLSAQVERTMPAGVTPATRKVIIYNAYKAILDRSKDVSADLIVMGRHRGGEAGARFLGTTADRVIRTCDVPCLVVSGPLSEGIRRIGVPLDFSDASQGALEVAFTWGLQLAKGTEPGSPDIAEIRVMHAGLPVARADDPDLEQRVIRPELERQIHRARESISGSEALHVSVDVLWASDPVECTAQWASTDGIDLLVMGTHGRSGLKRALLGSVALGVTRQAISPVLLVPPSLWYGQAHAPGLDRVLIATDFCEPAVEAAQWTVRDLAPGAEQTLVHVLEIPEPPKVLAGRYASRDELLQTAREGAEARLRELRGSLVETSAGGPARFRTVVREGLPAREISRMADDVDLVVMGEHGRSEVKRGVWTLLGSTVERVIRSSPAPVLVVRGAPQGPPRRLLVAVDGSEASLRALNWASFLAHHFGADLNAVYVESPVAFAYTAVSSVEERASWTAEGTRRLRDRLRKAGVDLEAFTLHSVEGRPAEEIVARAERIQADLIVLGSRGLNVIGEAVLGSVSSAVLRTASCSVLVVGEAQVHRVAGADAPGSSAVDQRAVSPRQTRPGERVGEPA